ncbi:adenylosuccinate synthetase, partial [Algiphilus sp. NNCM1]|nr:adenylosuccinate synthetase [Algiphilus acroporae]
GVTTGRPRRCGWFDAVVNRYGRDHRPSASLWLVRCGRQSLCGSGQRPDRHRAHQARRAYRPEGNPIVRGL